jgi:glycerol transport system ATP-binding protein
MSIVAKNISLTVDGECYLRNLSFELPSQGFFTIIGRTRAGKTTLLRVLAGLQNIDKGRLTLDGEDMTNIPPWKRNVGMVYQQFINYPHLNNFDNIAFPLRRAGYTKAKIDEAVSRIATLLKIEAFLFKRPSELSGGQQQRIALARALVKDSQLLVLDEPLVNLDYKLREQLREEFKKVFNEQNERLVIYSTTDPLEAMELDGTVIVIDEGEIQQIGHPREIYYRPANTRVATVFNDPPMNLMPGHVEDNQIKLSDGISTELPPHLAKLTGGNYTFGIRAADIHLQANAYIAKVDLAEINGSETILHINMGNIKLVLEQKGVHLYELGAQASINFDWEQLYAFDNQGNLTAYPDEVETNNTHSSFAKVN